MVSWARSRSVAARVLRLVGRPEVVDEPWFASAGERVKRVEMLDGAVADWIRARDFDEVYTAVDGALVCRHHQVRIVSVVAHDVPWRHRYPLTMLSVTSSRPEMNMG